MKQKLTLPDGEIVEKDRPVWKTPFNHDTDFEAYLFGTYNDEPSLTKQEFKEEADINVIMERFLRNGTLPPPVLPEHFLDLAERPTYFDTATRLAEANAVFYRLDAKLRAEHLNDPARWADAVVQAVDANDREAIKALGIEVPEKPQEKPEAGKSPVPSGGSSTPLANGAPAAPPGPQQTDSGK